MQAKGDFLVRGALNLATVKEIYNSGCRFIMANEQMNFDFCQAEVTDNGSLTLLTSWVRFAAKNSKTIYFINLPPKLLAIVKLCGLEGILPIKVR